MGFLANWKETGLGIRPTRERTHGHWASAMLEPGRSAARWLVRDGGRAAVNQHERFRRPGPGKRRKEGHRRRFGHCDRVAAGRAHSAFVCRIGQALRCVRHRLRVVVRLRGVLPCVIVTGAIAGCRLACRQHAVMGRAAAAIQHGRGRESLDGNRDHHDPGQKQAKARHNWADSKGSSVLAGGRADAKYRTTPHCRAHPARC